MHRSATSNNAGKDSAEDDLSWLTPEIVHEMAGSDFRFCLEALYPMGELTERALRSTAIMLLRDLGITESAWGEALVQLGLLHVSWPVNFMLLLNSPMFS